METLTVPSDKVQIGPRVSRDLTKKVRQIAKERDVTFDSVVEEALMSWYHAQPESKTIGTAEPSAHLKPGRPLKP